MDEPTLHQGVLFPLPPEQEHKVERRWYYVSDATGKNVLTMFAGGDQPHWTPVDLQREVPYLWTHAATAHADLRRWKIKGTVVLYPFTTPWWDKRRTDDE